MSESDNPVIVLSRELPEAFVALLESFAELRVVDSGPPAEVFDSAAVYLAAGVDPVPAPLIEQMPASVGLIANIATGTDNIDIDAATARGIAVSNTPVVTEDTADLAFALLLATCRRLSYCESRLREGEWALGAGALGTRVHGKTLGIIGMGAIGQAVARRAKGFGMDILYHGPSRKTEAERALDAEYCADLPDILGRADIISLNCPLTESSLHMMNSDTLALMKPGAVLINTGRGPLVDEQALVDALASGHLGGAGLDVFEYEPEVNPGLLAFDQVTLLPHIGSATVECRGDMAGRALQNIKQFLAEGRPLDPCN